MGVAAVAAGDLVETLSSPGPFTVFAPTNEAFGALPEGTLDTLLKPENKDQLVDILTYHVLPAQVLSTDLKFFQSVATVEGKNVRGEDKEGSLCWTQHQRAQDGRWCRQLGKQWCGTHH